MGPGDNSNPGVYFLIGSGTPGVYTRSGVYLDPALKRSYTVLRYTCVLSQCVVSPTNYCCNSPASFDSYQAFVIQYRQKDYNL